MISKHVVAIRTRRPLFNFGRLLYIYVIQQLCDDSCSKIQVYERKHFEYLAFQPLSYLTRALLCTVSQYKS